MALLLIVTLLFPLDEGARAYREGDYSKAINILEPLKDKSFEAEYYYFLSLMRGGKYEKLLEELKERKIPLASILKVKLFYELGDIDSLTGLWKKRRNEIEIIGDYVLYYILKLSVEKKDKERASRYIRELFSLNPEFFKMKDAILSLQGIIRGDTLLAYLRKYPGVYTHPELLYLMASLEDSLGMHDSAEIHYKLLINKFPGSSESLEALSKVKVKRELAVKVLYLNGKYRNVLKLTRHMKKRGDILYYRLLSLYRLRRYSRFLRDVYKHLRKFKGDRRKRLLFLGGIAGEYTGRYTLATTLLQKAIAEGDRRSIYEFTNFLFEKRGEWAYSRLLQSIKIIPMGEIRLFDLRRGILLFILRDSRFVDFLRSSLEGKGMVRASSLYWLFRTTEDSSYFFYLGDEFPLSYYYMRLSPSRIQLDDNLQKGNLDERSKALLILGERDEVVHNLLKGEIDPHALFRFAGSIADYYTAIWSFVKLEVKPSRECLPFIFPFAYRPIVDSVSRITGVEREIIWALMREESWFREDAVSSKGAVGLMQLLPATAANILGVKELDTLNLMDPFKNILAGALYIGELTEKFKSYHLAIAAYNAGERKVEEWIERLGEVEDDIFIEFIPYTETRNYVKRVMRSYYVYKMLLSAPSEF